MKKRSTEILQRLLKNPNEELSLKKLTDDYNITEKTLKGDVQELVEFARESGFGHSVYWDNHILRLDDRKHISEFMDAVYSMDPYQYKMSLEERKVYIIIELLCHDGYYSMQQLADELYVTRNTIINDCRLVDEYVKNMGLSLWPKVRRESCSRQRRIRPAGC